MKAPWATTALSDVSSIAYGYTESASSDPMGSKFLRITDLQNNTVIWDQVPYCPINPTDLRKHRLMDGDIVFARTGATTGKSFLVRHPPEAVPASYLIRLRLTDPRITPEFLGLFFQTKVYWKAIREGSSGSAQGGFNASKLGALKLPLPSVEEQRRIVAMLDEAFAAIAVAAANAEKNLANARELRQSGLDNLWTLASDGIPRTILADALALVTYGFTNPMPTADEGPYMVTAKNVRGGEIDYQNTRFTTQNAFDQLLTDKSRPVVGDILLTKDGTLGRVAMVDREGICINQSVALLRPNDGLLSEFLKFMLMTSDYQRRMIAEAGGTTIKHIYITRVDKMRVQIPDLAKQQSVVLAARELMQQCDLLGSGPIDLSGSI